MSIIKTRYFIVKQKKIQYFLCVLSAKVLNEVCSTSVNNMSGNKEIYQRKLDERRVAKIKEFAKRECGSMPTTIVLNSKRKLDLDDQYLIIDTSKDNFFVIDGQHRIAGASELDDYNFSVAIFDNIDEDFQSELFLSINNEQKKVNSNVRFSMKSNDRTKTPEKVLKNIIQKLNTDMDSPFFDKIRMDDREIGRNKISISAFGNAFLNYIYNSDDYYKLKDNLETCKSYNFVNNYELKYKIDEKRYFLWKFYVNNKEEILYKIILNYFTAVSRILYKDWNSDNNILCKTTGFNALALLFRDVYHICEKEDNNFSYNNLFDILSNLSILSDKFNVSMWGLGRIGAINLYKEFKKHLDIDETAIDYDNINRLSDDL